MHQCRYCAYETGVLRSLDLHERSHAGEKPFKCTGCSYTSRDATGLKRHTASQHTGERPHRCGECNYAGTTALALKRHMMAHTGERPHRCSLCSLCSHAGRSSDMLAAHMRVHTGERPYRCGGCPYPAKTRGALYQHIKAFSHEKGYG